MCVAALLETRVLGWAFEVGTGEGSRCWVDWQWRNEGAGLRELGVEVDEGFLGARSREEGGMLRYDVEWAG